VAVVDDVQRVARELFRLNVAMKLFPQRVGWNGGMGRIAKAAGATEEQVVAWMAGECEPTAAQALAVLDALPLPSAVPAEALNGAGK
jgi:hypothetical protein